MIGAREGLLPGVDDMARVGCAVGFVLTNTLGGEEGADEGDGDSDGVDEGAKDGVSVGESVGVADGLDEGDMDGVSVGESVDEGDKDGVSVGESVGVADGVEEGAMDGVSVGESVGVADGVDEGDKDGGDKERVSVGENVPSSSAPTFNIAMVIKTTAHSNRIVVVEKELTIICFGKVGIIVAAFDERMSPNCGKKYWGAGQHSLILQPCLGWAIFRLLPIRCFILNLGPPNSRCSIHSGIVCVFSNRLSGKLFKRFLFSNSSNPSLLNDRKGEESRLEYGPNVRVDNRLSGKLFQRFL